MLRILLKNNILITFLQRMLIVTTNNNNNNVAMENTFEDEEIERLIEAELKLLGDDYEVVDGCDGCDDFGKVDDTSENNNTVDSSDGLFNDAITNYLNALKVSERRAESVLQESKEIVSFVENSNRKTSTEELLKRKLQEELYIENEDLISLRNTVLKDLEKEEEEENHVAVKQEKNDDTVTTATSEEETIDEIKTLEEQTEKELNELTEKQNEEAESKRKVTEKLRKESIVNDLLNEEKRRKHQSLIEIFRTKQEEEQQLEAQRLEEDLHKEEKKINNVAQKINELIDNEMMKEKERLNELKREMKRNEELKMNKAAICIQKNFRMAKIRRVYYPKLVALAKERKEIERLGFERRIAEEKERLRMEEERRKEKEKARLREIEAKNQEKETRKMEYEKMKTKIKKDNQEMKNELKDGTNDQGETEHTEIFTPGESNYEAISNKPVCSKEGEGDSTPSLYKDSQTTGNDANKSASNVKNTNVSTAEHITKVTTKTFQNPSINSEDLQPLDETLSFTEKNQSNTIKDLGLGSARTSSDDKTPKLPPRDTETGPVQNDEPRTDNLIRNDKFVETQESLSNNTTDDIESYSGNIMQSGNDTTNIKKLDDSNENKEITSGTNTVDKKNESTGAVACQNAKCLDSSCTLTSDDAFHFKPDVDIQRNCIKENVKPFNDNMNTENVDKMDYKTVKKNLKVNDQELASDALSLSKKPVLKQIDDSETVESNDKIDLSKSSHVKNSSLLVKDSGECEHLDVQCDETNPPTNSNEGCTKVRNDENYYNIDQLSSVKRAPECKTGEFGESRCLDNKATPREHPSATTPTTSDDIHSFKSNNLQIPEKFLPLYEAWLRKTDSVKRLDPIKRKNRVVISASSDKRNVKQLSLEQIQKHITSFENSTLVLHNVDAFPVGISKHFPSIDSLLLIDSHIQNCYGGIEKLQHLTTLKLKKCCCSNMSLRSKQLRVLDISENNITNLFGLSELQFLSYLDASDNRISKINGIEECRNMVYLNLDNNQLISLKGLGHLSKLSWLSLRHNDVTSLPEISLCRRLVKLDVTENNLIEVPQFEDNALLTSLSLDSNTIQHLDGMADCWLPLLIIISASNNRLEDVSPLFNLPHLLQLNVKGNLISNLNNISTRENVPFLQQICLVDNPVLEINKEHLTKCLNIVDNLSMDIEETLERLQTGASESFQKLCFEQAMTLLSICNQLEKRNDENQTFKSKIPLLDKLDEKCERFYQIHKKLTQLEWKTVQGEPTPSKIKDINHHSFRAYTENDSNKAIQIQAVYRGYRVRIAYLSFKKYMTSSSVMHDGMDDVTSEFDYEEEINLEDFEMNENDDLLEDWQTPSTPLNLNNLKKPGNEQPPR
uniref:Leucine-rich repeat and IQ domain-containing protein 1 n=1 Tax=Clytia hemisphaerica TaxID=252671 RepID=A0A7M5ULP8_9CNID